MGQTNPPFMSGVPEFLVLRQLSRQEMYGYELAKAIRAASNDVIALGEGVIYPVLHGLERSGALKSKRKPVSGRTRVYYSLTKKGQLRLQKLQDEWLRIQGGISNALELPSHA